MQKSEFSTKNTLKWILFTFGFYIFYVITYILLVKSMLSPFNWLLSDQSNFIKNLKAGDIFWYGLFLLALGFVLYLANLLVSYAPKPRIAASIDAALVVFTQIFLLVALPGDLHLIPHLFINAAFVVALLLTFRRKTTPDSLV